MGGNKKAQLSYRGARNDDQVVFSEIAEEMISLEKT